MKKPYQSPEVNVIHIESENQIMQGLASFSPGQLG